MNVLSLVKIYISSNVIGIALPTAVELSVDVRVRNQYPVGYR
jgi:hypothetical protein